MMIRVCAWCGLHLGYKPGPDRDITHGICADCHEEAFSSLSSLPLSTVLDRLHLPVFVMDDDARVVAGNALAARAVGRSGVALQGIYAGDLLECVNASGPGGCGKTDACSRCILRRTVEDTYATGASHAGVGVTLQRRGGGRPGSAELQITTERMDRGVLLRIDRITPEDPTDHRRPLTA